MADMEDQDSQETTDENQQENAAPVAAQPDNAANQQENAAPVAAQPDNAATILGGAPAAPVTPTPSAAELDADDADYAQAQQRGEIHAKDYNYLLANKSTAGKVATLFGLLVSGAGSGLTHQPNMLMDMMNKEIDRDLDAQKQSTSNAMNMWNLTYQHQLQQMQARQMAAGIPLTQANTELVKKQATLATQAAAKNKITLGLLNDMANSTSNNPAAQSALVNKVIPDATQANQQRNAQAASQMQAIQALSGQNAAQQPQGVDSGIDINRLNQMKLRGSISQQSGVPVDPNKGIDPSELGEVVREQGLVQQNRETLNNYVDVFKKLDAAHAAGRLNPADRDALITPLMDQMGNQLGLGGQGTKELAKSLFPEVTDWGDTRDDKFKQGLEHFKVLESKTPSLNAHGLKNAFPTLKLNDAQPSSGGSQPVERITKDGKTALFDPNTKKFLGYK